MPHTRPLTLDLLHCRHCIKEERQTFVFAHYEFQSQDAAKKETFAAKSTSAPVPWITQVVLVGHLTTG